MVPAILADHLTTVDPQTMTVLTKHWPPLLTIALSVFGGYLASPYLPAHIPVHWGIDGTISSYIDKGVGVYLNPAAMIVAYLFFTLIPYSDRRRVGELRELGIYEPLRNTGVYTFAYAQLLVIGIGLGFVNETSNYLVGIGCLLLILGVEAARSELADPVKQMFPRFGRLSDQSISRVGSRVQVSAGLGIAGALFGPYQILWLLVPASIFLVIEFRRQDT